MKKFSYLIKVIQFCNFRFYQVYHSKIKKFFSMGNHFQQVSIILFSSITDGNRPWGNSTEPPEWLLLLIGIYIVICVGYTMENVVVGTWKYFRPPKKPTEQPTEQPTELDFDRLDKVDFKKLDQSTAYDEFSIEEIEYLMKKEQEREDQKAMGDEFVRQLRKFNDSQSRRTHSDNDDLFTILKNLLQNLLWIFLTFNNLIT